MTVFLSEDAVNLNFPAIKSGPLTIAELRDAQRRNPGGIWMQTTAACTGRCETEPCDCCMQSCAAEGGQHADPVPSGTHRRGWLYSAWLRLVRWAT